MQRDDTATIPRHTHARTERQTQHTHTLARTLPTHTHECARLAFARCTKLYIQTLYTVEKRDAARQRDVSSGDVETTSVQRERLTQTERARSRVPRCDAVPRARARSCKPSLHIRSTPGAHIAFGWCVCACECVSVCARVRSANDNPTAAAAAAGAESGWHRHWRPQSVQICSAFCTHTYTHTRTHAHICQ